MTVVVLLFYVHGKHLRSCQDGICSELSGFPLHSEIGGTFGLIPYFCILYPQCTAAYRGSHHFWGYKPNFWGKKPSAESKWNAELSVKKSYFIQNYRYIKVNFLVLENLLEISVV